MDKNLTELMIKYWDNQPCNIKHSKLPVGTRRYFEQVTARRYHVEPHIVKFADFEKYKGKRVLEIGCGIGTDAQKFAEAGAIYVGTDISQVSLDIAKQRFEIFGLKGEFYNEDFLDVNFVDDIGEFDLVYCFGVLNHCPEVPKMIDNVLTTLHSGGTFKFMVYAKNSWKNAMIQGGFDQFEAQSGCPLALTYTEQHIRDMLKDFDQIKIVQDHCFMYNVDQYKKGYYVFEPWFEAMPEQMQQCIKEQLGWHLLVTATKR